jgi:hypothetical protein
MEKNNPADLARHIYWRGKVAGSFQILLREFFLLLQLEN